MLRDMPIVGDYRGCEIHAFQSVERIRSVVVPEIDHVLECTSKDALLSIISDDTYSPEARLLAARLVLEPAEQLALSRVKVSINRSAVKAMVAGLNSISWADPDAYTSLLVPRNPAKLPAKRPREYSVALVDSMRLYDDFY